VHSGTSTTTAPQLRSAASSLLPLTCVVDGPDAPHARCAVEVEEPAHVGASRLLHIKVEIQVHLGEEWGKGGACQLL
jgi:hypothetical protein